MAQGQRAAGQEHRVTAQEHRAALHAARMAHAKRARSHGYLVAEAQADVEAASDARLLGLMRELDPRVRLDKELEEALSTLAEDFIENVTNGACLVARHRDVPYVQPKDVQLYLERTFKMTVPGFGGEPEVTFPLEPSEVHEKRLELIRKATKKE